jgi:hypothetical protein
MKIPSFIIGASLLLGLCLGAPTADTLSRRACTITAPVSIQNVRRDYPDSVMVTEPNFMHIIKQTFNDNSTPIQVDMFVTFRPPPGSWGCQLEMYFPAGYSRLWVSNVAPPHAHPGPSRVNVFALPNPSQLPAVPTWNNVKSVDKYLFGTTANLDWVTANETPLPESHRIIINSATCREVMTFRFSVPDEVRDGGMEFSNTGGAGVRLVHNC